MNDAAPVTPAVNRGKQRKKGLDLLLLKTERYFLFVARPRLDCKPGRFGG